MHVRQLFLMLVQTGLLAADVPANVAIAALARLMHPSIDIFIKAWANPPNLPILQSIATEYVTHVLGGPKPAFLDAYLSASGQLE